MNKKGEARKVPEAKPRIRPRAKRNRSTGKLFTVSDELWALMAPLLPAHPNPHRYGGGAPARAGAGLRRRYLLCAQDGLPVERACGHRALRLLHGPRPFPGVGQGRLLSALLAGGPG